MKQLIARMSGIVTNYWWVFVGLLALLSLAISIVVGFGRSVWFDEGYSIMLAQRPLHELLELVKVDAHPPFYYLYLKMWGGLFGWSELSLRMSSAVPGALSVVLVMVIVRGLFSTKAAIVAGVFVLLTPFLVRYNFEIRMYSLITFFGVLGTWFLVKARTSQSKVWWLAYIGIVVLSMYTLYMSVVIWLAHALWLLYLDIVAKRNVFKRKHWLYFGSAVALFLPWMPVVFGQLQNSALPPYMQRMTLESLSSAVTMSMFYEPIWETSLALGAVLLIILFIAVWLLVHIRRERDRKTWRSVALLLFCSLTAVGFYALISLPPNPPRFTDRYLVHVSLYFYVLLAIVAVVGYSIGKRKAAVCLGVMTLGALCYGMISLVETGNYNFQRLQSTYGKVVSQRINCNDATIVASNPYAYIDMWYDLSHCDLRFYQPTDYTYTGGYAPLNTLSSTTRVNASAELNADRVAIIHFDDSEDFLKVDTRYVLEKEYDYQGMKLFVYRRILS